MGIALRNFKRENNKKDVFYHHLNNKILNFK